LQTLRIVASAAGMRPYVIAGELARQRAMVAIVWAVLGRGEEIARFRLAGFTQERNKAGEKADFVVNII
jgi:hypothetical protein